jgi:O-methyltransferase involved in polyketide biosynthesis
MAGNPTVNERPKTEAKLTGIPETLLIPLWARAMETGRSDAIVRDDKAAEIVSRIDYDFSRFRKARLTQLGVAVRTMLLDRAAQAFLDKNPRSCVINLGAGLDTRYARLRHDDTIWYELDLPESLDLRRRFFEETGHYYFLAGSVFDEAWPEVVETEGRAVLLMAEGLFMYFEEQELRPLFGRLAERFAGAQMLVEVQGPGIVGKSKRHDSLGKMDNAPEFKWGTSDSSDLTRWHSGIEIIDEWSFFDYHLDRAGWVGWLMRLPFLRKKYEPRIVHLRFGAPREGDTGGRRIVEGLS